MIVQPLVLPGLAYVLEHLWYISAIELERLGLNRETAWARFTRYMTMGPSKMLIADNVPVVAVGKVFEGDEWFTWFLASDKFEDHGKAVTREVRKLVREHDGLLRIYSLCVHKDLRKWLQVLGFVPDEWEGKSPAGWPIYRFMKD